MSAMATRKGINISGSYVVPHKLYWSMSFSYMYTLYSKKLKGWTKLCFILFLKLNDHPTRFLISGYVEFIPTVVSSN